MVWGPYYLSQLMGIFVSTIDWSVSRYDKTITCAHTTWAQTTLNKPQKYKFSKNKDISL